MNDESPLWKDSSSQWLNLGPFCGALVAVAAILVGGILFAPVSLPVFLLLPLPLAYMLWRYLVVRTRIYELTNQRMRITSGVINQTIDEIELYRVKDTQMFRTWWMRLVGVASISLETSDRTMKNLVIPAVSGGMELRELLRQQVELTRDRKRVREMDFDDVDGDALDIDLN